MRKIQAIFSEAKHWHKFEHYFAIYDQHLARFQNSKVAMLEIGVDRGGSLAVWQKFLGSQAFIYGMDINPDCRRFKGRLAKDVFIGDQADAKFLTICAQKMPKLDIILDDGGHFASQQIASFETLFPLLKDGGVYMVEDAHTQMFWRKYGRWHWHKGRLYRNGFIDYAKQYIDVMHAWHTGKESFSRWGLPRQQRLGQCNVSAWTRMIKSISFYDGVIVFEKAKVAEPLRIFTE